MSRHKGQVSTDDIYATHYGFAYISVDDGYDGHKGRPHQVFIKGEIVYGKTGDVVVLHIEVFHSQSVTEFLFLRSSRGVVVNVIGHHSVLHNKLGQDPRVRVD